MSPYDHRRAAGRCPKCGRFVHLNRHGQYRRHFVVERDGRRHLCATSGVMADGVVQLLAVDPTADARATHVRRLLNS